MRVYDFFRLEQRSANYEQNLAAALFSITVVEHSHIHFSVHLEQSGTVVKSKVTLSLQEHLLTPSLEPLNMQIKACIKIDR